MGFIVPEREQSITNTTGKHDSRKAWQSELEAEGWALTSPITNRKQTEQTGVRVRGWWKPLNLKVHCKSYTYSSKATPPKPPQTPLPTMD